MSGGELVAGVLAGHRVEQLFTLCGGHISPILVAASAAGIRVVDVRDEASAVFAADAVARLSGTPGVAVVTAGPGVTNTVTAVRNAQLAQSPVVVLGGAAATLLRGRGALQDIDQMALMTPHVKWAARVTRVGDLVPALARAFGVAAQGAPGPVFLEIPVDLLYPRETVEGWYRQAGKGRGGRARLRRLALERHLRRLFGGASPGAPAAAPPGDEIRRSSRLGRRRVASHLARCERPLLLVGSQAAFPPAEVGEVAKAIVELGIPAYLSGMARGLLGRRHPLLLRHRRRQALAEADLVLLAGVPCDFRLDYGRQIPSRTPVVAVNRSREELVKNRRPRVGAVANPGLFLRDIALLRGGGGARWEPWRGRLRQRDGEREAEIRQLAEAPGERVHPVALCLAIEEALDDDSVLVADGGDFVATASYVLSPRGPLRWLDPGPFGTLGVGGGFALGAKLCRPGAEVWVLWGDGSAAFSLAEIDTCVRHRLPLIAVVGNDGSWAQIARDQVAILGDDVGTVLRRSGYHRVAEGYGAVGLEMRHAGESREVLAAAKAAARDGSPVLVNAHLRSSDFRQGSLSM